MAGDWIKLETVTPDKPEMFALAEYLNCSHGEAFLACVRVWIWADQQSRDGHALGVTKTAINRVAGVTGFAEALQEVGWLQDRGGVISVPNFDRHNGKTAKERALATKRKVTERSRSNRDKNATREEKRREEIKPPIPPSGVFLRFWAIWPSHERKASQGKCWEIWRKKDFDQEADSIITHVESSKASEGWRGGYIPAPLTYLNQRRWEGAGEQAACFKVDL
jgi:hypothetical protein